MSDIWVKVIGEGSEMVVAMLDQNDDNHPAIRVYCRPDPDLGTCNTAIGFEDSDKGYADAQAALGRFGEKDAGQVLAMMREILK